jgi:predicted GIY-YIG superfamily endonuclease
MIFKIFILFQLFSCISGNIDQSITIKPLVYHLKLEEDNHYVGITYNLNQRYAQHISGNGAKWTKLHKPISVEQVWIEVLKN